MVENWPKIAERRRLGFPLTDLWRELTAHKAGAGMTYKAFRGHVLQVAAVMTPAVPQGSSQGLKAEPVEQPKLAERVVPSPSVETAPVSQKELFRLAREAREREAVSTASTPAPPVGKPDTSMIDGGEVWMSILGRQRVRELASLNLKLRSGDVDEADARPVLDSARREAWSKHLGIRADQLTEEDMNGPW